MTVSKELVALAGGYGLSEAARWYPEHGLVYSDMLKGGVFRLPPGAGEPEVIIPKRKAVGGLVAHADGGFVVSGRNITHTNGESSRVLLEPRDDEQFFNDFGADGRGRLFCGAMPKTELRDAGRFYLIDLDGSVSVITEDLKIANGVHADPGDTVLYSVDSGRLLVWKFALADTAAEMAASRELFVDTSEYDAQPDGLTVAADGSVWVAMAGAGCVVGWDVSGTKIAEIASPHALTSSLAFGGPGLDELYILTGDMEDHPNPEGGTVFRMASPTVGLPAPYARVRPA